MLLIEGLGRWVLAFDGASRDELPVVASLTALNGLLVLLFFYLASHVALR